MGQSDSPDGRLSGTLGELNVADRRHYARRLLVKAVPFAPLILASILTTKAVAASKPVTTLPLSL